MVAARVSRLSAEVLGDEGTRPAVTTLETGAAVAPSGEGEVRASRLVVEVLGSASYAAVTTLETAAAVAASGTAAARVSRLTVEVLGSNEATPSVTSLETSAAVAPAGTGAARVSRLVVEAMAPDWDLGIVTPLALRSLAPFLHNWRANLTVRSLWQTAIATDPDTGVKHRSSLRIRPSRTMDLLWTRTGRDDMQSLERFMESASDGAWQVPLYCDQTHLLVAHGSAATVLATPARRSRMSIGSRVLVQRPDGTRTTHTLASAGPDSVTLAAALGTAAPAGSLLWPVLDVLADFDAGGTWLRRQTAEVQLSAQEIPGASAQTPTWPPTPVGGAPRGPDDYPIWTWPINWSNGISKRWVREGFNGAVGRGLAARADGPRATLVMEADILAEGSAEIWQLLRWFDSMRGMAGSFWIQDPENVVRLADIAVDGTSVTVLQDDYTQAAISNTGYLALEHPSLPGEVAVKRINTVSPVSGTYVITFSDGPLPTNLDPDLAVRVSRARLAMFGSDELEENYYSDGVATARIPIHEIIVP